MLRIWGLLKLKKTSQASYNTRISAQGRVLGIIGQTPRVSNSNRLRVV